MQLFIVNLQKTPYDMHATVRVFARTDAFMQILLTELGVDPAMDRSIDLRDTWDAMKDAKSAAKRK